MPFSSATGSRAQVWHGTAAHTAGGLTRSDLFQDKFGRIRSKAASATAKRKRNLAGYLLPKGSHRFVLQQRHSKRGGYRY